MTRNFRLEREYRHPPTKVWRALTDRRALSTWLMETDFEPVLGRTFTFRSKPQPGWDGITHCEVTELDEPRALAYTWRGGPGPGQPLTLDTVVRWTLSPTAAGTRLVLEHRGFEGFRAILVSFMLQGGWWNMMRGRLAGAIASA
jgi:uncharacterized protein YndB with AHSA1/START domain